MKVRSSTSVAGACWDAGLATAGTVPIPGPTLPGSAGGAPQVGGRLLLLMAQPSLGTCSGVPEHSKSCTGEPCKAQQGCGFSRAAGVVVLVPVNE